MDELLNIIVVDDDEADYESTLRALTCKSSRLLSIGNITWAKSIQEALEVLEQIKPQILLLDLSLPDANGLSGLEKLRDLYPELPVILLTGLDDEQVAVSALRSGAQDYVVKGGSADNLRRAIRYSLQRSQIQSELRKAQAVANTASNAKSAFLANMSHEIRSPLTAIIGFTEVALLEPSSNQQKDALITVKRNSDHLLQVINDILDISKIEAGKFEVDLSDVSIFEMLTDLKSAMQNKASEKDLSFFYTFNFPLPRLIHSDSLRLKQILYNLISNAIKFTDKGNVEVKISYNSDLEKVIFSISDSGIGIPVDKQSKLFQSFNQADSSITRQFGGTGLGLVICKELTQRLGGEISFQSTFGQGSTFTFSVATGDVAPENMITSMDDVRSHNTKPNSMEPIALGGRILLVEDGQDNQELISFLLERVGIEVTLAENGKIGVAKAMAENFDLVLMDMQMPVMDGYSATKELRNKGLAVPIIALTASAMDGTAERCAEAGCDQYLSKPFSHKLFYETISKWLIQTSTSADDGCIHSRLIEEDPSLEFIVKKFVGRLPSRLEELDEALKNNDWEQVKMLAHRLNGAAATHGYPLLSECSAKLEHLASQDDTSDAAKIFKDMNSIISRIE